MRFDTTHLPTSPDGWAPSISKAKDQADSAAGRELITELAGSSAGRELAAELAGSGAGRELAATLARGAAGRGLARVLAGSAAGRELALGLAGSDAGRVLALGLAGSAAGRVLALGLAGSAAGLTLTAELAGSRAGRELAATLADSTAGRVLAVGLAGSDAGLGLARVLAGSDAGRALARGLAGSDAGGALAAELAGSDAGGALAAELAGSDAGRALTAELAGSDAGRLLTAMLAGSDVGRVLAVGLAGSDAGLELAATLAGSTAGRDLAAELAGSDAGLELAAGLAVSGADLELVGAVVLLVVQVPVLALWMATAGVAAAEVVFVAGVATRVDYDSDGPQEDPADVSIEEPELASVETVTDAVERAELRREVEKLIGAADRIMQEDLVPEGLELEKIKTVAQTLRVFVLYSDEVDPGYALASVYPLSVELAMMVTQLDPETPDVDRKVVELVASRDRDDPNVVGDLGDFIEAQSDGLVKRRDWVLAVAAGTGMAGFLATVADVGMTKAIGAGSGGLAVTLFVLVGLSWKQDQSSSA